MLPKADLLAFGKGGCSPSARALRASFGVAAGAGSTIRFHVTDPENPMSSRSVSRRGRFRRTAHSRANQHTHFAEARNVALLEATTAAAALIAQADGWVTPDEKRQLVRVLRQDPRLSVFEPEEVLLLFERTSQLLIEFPDEGRRQAFDAIARIGSRQQARALIDACSQVAAADGIVDAEERSVGMEIAGVLRLDPACIDGAAVR